MLGRHRSGPAIGLSTGRILLGDRVTDGTQSDYSDAVVRAGGRPYLLTSRAVLSPEAVLAPLDGLLLTGGGDIDPARYGESPIDATSGVDPERDEAELGLLAAAREGGLPVLGICRGCQLLNVALGGTLVQDLPGADGRAHLVLGARQQLSHVLTVQPDSALHALVGRPDVEVNSIHHQGIARPASALRPVAWAEDGLIEAVEGRHEPLLGVQWHPENLIDSAPVHLGIFRWLVEESGRRGRSEPVGPRRASAGG